MECVVYFEDYRTDVLSRLYIAAYQENTASIRFSGGNGKLVSEVEALLSNDPEVFVIVVLDMVPENSDIVTIYNNLKMIGKVYPQFLGRYIIIPTVCAEYRFIKAFHDFNLFQSHEDIDLCLGKGDFRNSRILNQLFAKDSAYYKNFEKYCKFVLKYTVSQCISSDSVENKLFQKFYLEDCICADCDYRGKSLRDKSCKYINVLPFVLVIDLLEDIRGEGDMDYKKLYSVHDSLVKEFNQWVDRYKEIYGSPGTKYRHVTSMPETDFKG